MSLEMLKDDLKKNNLKGIYLFCGQEEYLMGYYLKAIEDALLQPATSMMNKNIFDGKVDIYNLLDSCETMPVFSDRRLVVVKNSGLFKGKKKPGKEEGKTKHVNEDLINYIQNHSKNTCLMFMEPEIDKRMKIVDAIKKNGLIVEFPYQKPDELTRWVVKVFRSYKKEIDMITAAQLVDYSEQGMNEILNEIKKVVSFLGDKSRVEIKDIQNVCTISVKGRIFDLTDAIAEKNSVKALMLLNDMLLLKEPIQKILIMITRQFRHFLEMKLLKEEGLSQNEAASRIGMSPYAATKVSKQAAGLTVEKLKKAIKQSLEYDIAIKTGKIDERIAVELLITEFAK